MECSNLLGNSCILSSAENGEKDALAAVRMMVSLLSIMGSSAIIASIIKRRRVWTPTIHPIFQLSVVDLILGLLWVIGAYLWFRGASNRAWCFAVSLLTVVLECVSANLTLVYAFLAHSSLKNNYSRIDTLDIQSFSARTWHPVKTISVYLTAWILPIVTLVAIFSSLAVTTDIVRDANACTCWCIPYLGNILPFSLGWDEPSATYMWHIRKLIVAFSSLLFLNFSIVLVVMVVLYWKILKEIKIVKSKIADLDDDVMGQAIKDSQASTRKRIVHFLAIFLAITLATVILCIMVIYNEGRALHRGVTIRMSTDLLAYTEPGHKFLDILLLFQSVTVPLQGFLNAIVYGRTRKDFVRMMSSTRIFFVKTEGNSSELHVTQNEVDSDDEVLDDGEERKAILYSESLTHTSDSD